jgi:hypothetical protein
MILCHGPLSGMNSRVVSFNRLFWPMCFLDEGKDLRNRLLYGIELGRDRP